MRKITWSRRHAGRRQSLPGRGRGHSRTTARSKPATHAQTDGQLETVTHTPRKYGMSAGIISRRLHGSVIIRITQVLNSPARPQTITIVLCHGFGAAEWGGPFPLGPTYQCYATGRSPAEQAALFYSIDSRMSPRRRRLYLFACPRPSDLPVSRPLTESLWALGNEHSRTCHVDQLRYLLD